MMIITLRTCTHLHAPSNRRSSSHSATQDHWNICDDSIGQNWTGLYVAVSFLALMPSIVLMVAILLILALIW